MIFAPFPLKKKEKDIKKQKLKKTFLWKNNTYRYNFQKCENRLKRQWFSNFPYKHRKKDLRKRTHCVVKLDKLQIWEYNHNGRVKCYTVFLCEKCIFYPWGKKYNFASNSPKAGNLTNKCKNWAQNTNMYNRLCSMCLTKISNGFCKRFKISMYML